MESASEAYAVTDAASGPRAGGVGAAYRTIGASMALTDALCLLLGAGAAYSIRFGLHPLTPGYLGIFLVGPFVWVGIFYSFRLYDIQHLSPVEELRRAVGAASLGMVLAVMVSYWYLFELSRIWMAMTWTSILLLELGTRRAWRWRVARGRVSGTLAYRTIIVGINQEADELASSLARPGTGFKPIGFVSTSSRESAAPLPLLGSADRLEHLAKVNAAECFFVASTAVDNKAVVEVLRCARKCGIEMRISANLPEVFSTRLTFQQFQGTPCLSVRAVRLSGIYRIAKRASDLLIASIGLMLTLPVWIAIIIAVKVSSRGPMFFKQERVTLGGESFMMFKFRTMVRDAEQALLADDLDYTTPFFKRIDDSRSTKIGSLLRRLSLDELPQLLNVILGDMSIVGPRPLPVEQVEANIELLEPRHEVRAGMTGWWQVQGRSLLTSDEALKMDLFYIENWSMTLDLYIMLKTVGAIMTRSGAF